MTTFKQLTKPDYFNGSMTRWLNGSIFHFHILSNAEGGRHLRGGRSRISSCDTKAGVVVSNGIAVVVAVVVEHHKIAGSVQVFERCVVVLTGKIGALRLRHVNEIHLD